MYTKGEIFDIPFPTDNLTVRDLKTGDDTFRTTGDYFYPGREWSRAHAVTREVQLATYYWHRFSGAQDPYVYEYFTQERLGRIIDGLREDYVALGLAADRDKARELISTIEEQVQAIVDRSDAPIPGAVDRFGTRVAESRTRAPGARR